MRWDGILLGIDEEKSKQQRRVIRKAGVMEENVS